MPISRVYPSNATQAGLLHEALKPALDKLYNFADLLEVSSHPVTPATGWSFAPGVMTGIHKVGPLCTFMTRLNWGTGGSAGNLFALPPELRPSLANTVGIGTFVNAAAGGNPARVGQLFCSPTTGVIAYSTNYSTGLANNAEFALNMTWVVAGA